MSNEVILDYTIQYTACELAHAPIETKPVLRVFYDAHFDRTEADGGVVTIALDENDLSKTYKGTLKARTKERMDNQFPMTANIGLVSYAETRNDAGNACMTSAGSNHLGIAKVYSGKRYEEELPLLIQNMRINGGEPVEKGRIKVTVDSFKVGRNVRPIEWSKCALGSSVEANSELLVEFLNARMNDEASIPDTWGEQTSNVRAPMDLSTSGIELTQLCFLPADAFGLDDPMVTNVEYFQNAAERQMARRGLSLKHDYASLDWARKAEIATEMFIYASQSWDYVSDKVYRSNRMKDAHYDPRMTQMTDDWHNAGCTASGDCEDTAKLNQSMTKGFKSLVIDPQKHPHVSEMQWIMHHYTTLLILATVHGAKADDDTERIGAHLHTFWFPKTSFKRGLMRCAAGRAIADQLPLHVEDESLELPVLLGEGTGRIHTLGTGMDTLATYFKSKAAVGEIAASHPACYDPLINARRYIGANMRTKNGFKMEIPHDRGAASPFYLGSLLAITSDFMDEGYNTGAFTICQVNKNGEISRGALFTDMINDRDNIAFVPARPIPEPVMRIVHEATALREPIRPFVLDHDKPMDGLKKHPLLERLKTGVASLGRTGESPFGSVDLFMRPHQFNSSSIDLMLEDLSRLRHVYKVDYELEHITNTICNYRLMLYVNENAL